MTLHKAQGHPDCKQQRGGAVPTTATTTRTGIYDSIRASQLTAAKHNIRFCSSELIVSGFLSETYDSTDITVQTGENISTRRSLSCIRKKCLSKEKRRRKTLPASASTCILGTSQQHTGCGTTATVSQNVMEQWDVEHLSMKHGAFALKLFFTPIEHNDVFFITQIPHFRFCGFPFRCFASKVLIQWKENVPKDSVMMSCSVERHLECLCHSHHYLYISYISDSKRENSFAPFHKLQGMNKPEICP